MSDIQQISNLVSELIKQHGPLLTQRDLAMILKRSVGGLRYSLCKGTTPAMVCLRSCCCRIGRGVYYPTDQVAKIILEQGGGE